jgi:hypothetical protein
VPHPSNRLNRIRIVRQETKVFLIRVKDQDGRVIKPGSGLVAYMTVKASVASTDALISKQSGDGIEPHDEDQWRVTLETDDTEIVAGTYKWDFWLEDQSKTPVVRRPVVRAADAEVVNGVTTFPVVGSGP